MTAPSAGDDDVVAKGVEALQSAAREMIAAARAMLDVADELVADPRAVGTVVEAMSAWAGRASRAASSPPGRSGRPGSVDGSDDDDGGDDGGGVQRIPVS